MSDFNNENSNSLFENAYKSSMDSNDPENGVEGLSYPKEPVKMSLAKSTIHFKTNSKYSLNTLKTIRRLHKSLSFK